ncbi:hypothetical protein B0H14DRAFT_2497092 [Mycena olivaceomarginata]|nr:hypothetical protein B0H14DRAFT_2497092 [Mycena olivaceomarginata]
MSQSHRNHSAKHALPDDPSYLDFPRTDGDPELWPTNTERKVDSEGCVNFMQEVALDEPLSIKWRVGVGDAVSVALKLPPGKPYVLRDFPNGYRMFDHHKGKAAAPRHDVYLFGAESKARFRSVPEFIPHAVWLMGDPSDVCKCKYCSKKPQREITSSMGNLLRNSSSPSPSRPTRPKAEKAEKPERKRDVLSKPRLAERLQNSKTYAAVQKTVNVPKASPHIQTKAVMLVERNNNLRDACRPVSEGCLPRWFREGELVWCALQNPIVRPDLGVEIKFWPGIVDEVKLLIDDNVPADGTSPWVIRQSTAYKVQFLAVQRSYFILDNMIIPYQTYIIHKAILEEMVARPVENWDLNPDTLTAFDPCPPPHLPPPSFADALTPLALALQIASTLSGYWCLTDEWDAKITLPLPPAPRPPPPPLSSLQSAIEFAGNNNVNVGSISTGPRGLGLPPPPRVVHQTRFQGLWWGGERIWADDLVRLKVPRNCLAPAGANHIFAPSGPGTKSRLLAESQGGDATLYGATSRGVFMKIDTIFLVDGGGKRECRVTGMLYELADIDWEDPNLPRPVFDSISSASASASAPPPGQPTAKLPTPGSSGDMFALPPAPTGFKFRPILAPGHEVVLCLSLISGRYYPRILQHPLVRPILNEVIPLDPTTMLEAGYLWALEGLFGGYKNAVDPTFYRANREKMMSDASREAMAALDEHLRDRRSEMDVD